MRKRIAKLADGYGAGAPTLAVGFALANAFYFAASGYDFRRIVTSGSYGWAQPIVWLAAAVFLWLALNIAVCATIYGGDGLFISQQRLVLLNPVWFSVPVEDIEAVDVPPPDGEGAKRALLLRLKGGRVKKLPTRLLEPIAPEVAQRLTSALQDLKQSGSNR